jgi:predicted RNA-binding protein with RPS1 domain
MNNDSNVSTTLVEGATVTGVVESKNQHGATVNVAGESTFLPVAQLGDTSLSDLTKGTEVAVIVVDTTGAKPRVAIAEVTETAVESEETVEGDELAESILKLAGAWGASVKFETGKRPTSTKPAKPRTIKVAAAVVPVSVVTLEPVVVTPTEPDSAKVAYLKSLNLGDTVKATVKFKKDFGAFMTVGGIGFGLLHVSEVPGTKPEQRKAFIDGLRYKQELTVQVVTIDLKEERLGLSLIAGEKESFFDTLKVGTLVEGTVSGSKEIGAFINLGLTTGFMHVSEVNGENREVRDAGLAALKVGDKLELVVVDVNRAKKEVRLSQRRVGLVNVTPGSSVTGTVVQVRNNVVIVDLPVGARGFLPKTGGKRYESGEEITATVKSVDVARGTIDLV